MTRTKLVAALVVAAALLGAAAPATAHHNSTYLMGVGQSNNRWSSYDYRQNFYGDVDWPVGFVFHGNANVTAVKDGVCLHTTHSWKYCTSGGPQWLSIQAIASPWGPAWTGFDNDSGRKRFSQSCTSTNWTSHMRFYAPQVKHGRPDDAFYSPDYGFMVVGTTHLDYRDRDGCAGREHGRTETAENWFIGTIRGVPGWTDTYDNPTIFYNANAPHTVNRTVGGVAVPHVYDNDGYGTLVNVP